jgi:hypothetical protein
MKIEKMSRKQLMELAKREIIEWDTPEINGETITPYGKGYVDAFRDLINHLKSLK